MVVARLIAALAAVAALWLAASVGGHGPASHVMADRPDAHAIASVEGMPHEAMQHCCGSEADHTASCHSLLAVPTDGAQESRDVVLASVDGGPAGPLPTGREPPGLLDPPRPV